MAFQGLLLAYQPVDGASDNAIAVVNELAVSLYLYLLLCLTDFMIEHDKRDLIAWVLLFLVVFTVLFNLVKFLIFFDWCYLIRKFKKKCIKHKKHAMDTKKTNVDELKK